jgi:biotin carboxyl carrier protein
LSPEGDAASGAWLEAVREVVAAVQASDVTELEIANGQFRLRLRREPRAGPPSAVDADQADGRFHAVVSPFTGVFYRSPTPSARPYVTEGEWVDAASVVGLVETMKVFNELNAEVAGRIARFAAESGQLVHAGEVLVLIEPGERVRDD